MTRKNSKREIEQTIDRLSEEQPGAPTVMERAVAERENYPIRGPADPSGGPYKNKFRGPPDLSDGEDLVVALVPAEDITSAYADGGQA